MNKYPVNPRKDKTMPRLAAFFSGNCSGVAEEDVSDYPKTTEGRFSCWMSNGGCLFREANELTEPLSVTLDADEDSRQGTLSAVDDDVPTDLSEKYILIWCGPF